MDKIHKGFLNHWVKKTFIDGYIYWGISDGHPQYHGRWMHTSRVVREYGKEIETLNSRYTLGSKYTRLVDSAL